MEEGSLLLCRAVDQIMFRNYHKFAVSSWSKIISGHPAFILGNGPSLLDNDLSLLDGCFTVGINRAYKVYQSIILMWQDENLYKDGWEDILSSPAIKFCRKQINKENRFETFELITGNFRLTSDPSKLYGNGCSGVLGVELAVAMGASAVVLLGMDCEYSDGKTDFYGVNTDHTSHSTEGFHAGMRWVKKHCPVPVFNCSTAPYWKSANLMSVIQELKPIRLSRLQWYAKLLLESETMAR